MPLERVTPFELEVIETEEADAKTGRAARQPIAKSAMCASRLKRRNTIIFFRRAQDWMTLRLYGPICRQPCICDVTAVGVVEFPPLFAADLTRRREGTKTRRRERFEGDIAWTCSRFSSHLRAFASSRFSDLALRHKDRPPGQPLHEDGVCRYGLVSCPTRRGHRMSRLDR